MENFEKNKFRDINPKKVRETLKQFIVEGKEGIYSEMVKIINEIESIEIKLDEFQQILSDLRTEKEKLFEESSDMEYISKNLIIIENKMKEAINEIVKFSIASNEKGSSLDEVTKNIEKN